MYPRPKGLRDIPRIPEKTAKKQAIQGILHQPAQREPGGDTMKLLIIILLTCGQPDIAIVGKPGEAPQYNYFDNMSQSEFKYLDKKMHEKTTEIWVVPDNRGICT